MVKLKESKQKMVKYEGETPNKNNIKTTYNVYLEKNRKVNYVNRLM